LFNFYEQCAVSAPVTQSGSHIVSAWKNYWYCKNVMLDHLHNISGSGTYATAVM